MAAKVFTLFDVVFFIFVKASSRNFLLVSLEWPLLINFLF